MNRVIVRYLKRKVALLQLQFWVISEVEMDISSAKKAVWPIVAAAVLSMFLTPATAMNLNDYAKSCFAAADLLPSDIPRRMDCTAGDLLDVTVNGTSVAQTTCNDITDRGSCDPVDQCDMKAWLNDRCYGNSYLTTFKAPSNADVTVALLCRHKTRNTDQPRLFDDIAMIVHNSKNGETCWFQTRDGEGKSLNGKRVPNPVRPVARLFWLKPATTAGIECIKCHDSGAFITSPWLNQAKSARLLRDMKKSPYHNSTPPFDQWPKPVYISVGRFGLKNDKDKSCTDCHRIAAKVGKLKPYTCDNWIEDATSNVLPDGRIFMPPRMRAPLVGKHKPHDWNHRFRDHVESLKDCCRKVATDPTFAGDAICKLTS